ncbi:MAG: cytochrome P460 family protein [Methyloligellaceae bacterium]
MSAFISAGLVFSAVAQVNENVSQADEEPIRSGPVKPAEDPRGPRRHFRIKNPAHLSEDEAERIYVELKQDMARRYRLSGQSGAANYQRWKRYNRAPYRSASHGNRLLNNYANETARAYGRFEQAGIFPVGSIIAKDSITVTSDGVAEPGALYLMEKMPDGFNYVSGNWRYTMIMPDGSIFGTTRGEGSKRVVFCISCHLAAERHDHLFFLPKKYRRN